MKIPVTKPTLGIEEIELLSEVIKSGWVVQGKYVKEFEERFARFTGAKHAIALNSCTSGQFLASTVFGLKEGDEVIVPAFTWISTANSIDFFRAKPVFCDVEFDTFNIDANKIESLITEKTKAVYPVNLFGLPADLDKIYELSVKYNLKVAEDCACGLAGYSRDRHCGTFGDMGIFSFHPRKSITTGEGGMLITDNDDYAEYVRSLREHGALRSDLERHEGNRAFLLTDYPHIGFNYRMTDIQGALGVAQMDKLPLIIKEKQEIAEKFHEKIKDVSWLHSFSDFENKRHGYQAFVCWFKPEETEKAIRNKDLSEILKLHEERNAVMEKLENLGIASRQGTHAVHIQKYYKDKYHFSEMDFPVSYAADRLSFTLPFYPFMKDEEIDYLFAQLKNIGL
ncbi:MAG: aminotransferase DegT [Candidatus Cloacimonadota bacterium]|nr:MAG: aminotransferase DegT [Candidatus Cloacimonadota bacterium]